MRMSHDKDGIDVLDESGNIVCSYHPDDNDINKCGFWVCEGHLGFVARHFGYTEADRLQHGDIDTELSGSELFILSILKDELIEKEELHG